ncbi:acyl carrier protein [Streptomyces sp. V4I8]|uniref:acyl carrier protein n=1 Tax=Streptomyces sp. V4I8 TaxID=3156469 RepID=UPI00351133C3
MSASYDALKDKLIKFEAPEDMITPEATLDELGLDSLAVVEIFVALQEEFGISLDESKAVPALTVKETLAMFEEQLAARRDGARQ